jgi:hypothetical protein
MLYSGKARPQYSSLESLVGNKGSIGIACQLTRHPEVKQFSRENDAGTTKLATPYSLIVVVGSFSCDGGNRNWVGGRLVVAYNFFRCTGFCPCWWQEDRNAGTDNPLHYVFV